MTPEINTVVNLGIGGFAIWIMYLQSKASADANKATAARMKEKDQELITEIDKRDKRNSEQQDAFNTHIAQVHESTTAQLSENTKALTGATIALQENVRIMEHLNTHFKTPPVIIQNNTGEIPKQ